MEELKDKLKEFDKRLNGALYSDDSRSIILKVFLIVLLLGVTPSGFVLGSGFLIGFSVVIWLCSVSLAIRYVKEIGVAILIALSSVYLIFLASVMMMGITPVIGLVFSCFILNTISLVILTGIADLLRVDKSGKTVKVDVKEENKREVVKDNKGDDIRDKYHQYKSQYQNPSDSDSESRVKVVYTDAREDKPVSKSSIKYSRNDYEEGVEGKIEYSDGRVEPIRRRRKRQF